MVILQLDEQPPLIQAVFSGEIDTVKKLLESKQDVNYQDFEKRSALHAAAYRGDAAIAELLIEHGARVNTKDWRWVTPLHRACCSGSEETVCILLKNQADTGARDRLWQTPLHIAAAYNSLECVQYLLERIQNPNVTDRSGRTALHHAVLNGHNDIVELLISKGCIVNACDKKDCRPIHWASHKGHTETIEILLENGADINAKDRNQYTPLHVAAASGSVGVIQTLLMHGASIEAQNAYGNTPLHIACLNGHGACAQELIRHNADKEAVNYRGQTPLHIAAASTHGVHCLNMLVGLGVNINKQSMDGRTALHMTAIHGRFTRSKTLIDNGAIVDSVDKNGCTALHIAAQYGHELLSSTLLTYGANASKKGYEGRTPLHMCCLSGYIECCRIFIKAGVDLNSRDDLGKTPLHCAAYKGAAECVDLLVSSGSDIKAVDSLYRIPLHYASAQGFYFCVFTLVSTGSNPNSPDNEGCTALHLASAYDIDGKCVNYLLEHKADPKIRDLKGFTAIHYAVAGNNINALRFLLVALGTICLYGSDMPPTTPLHIAAKNGNMEILEALMPYFPDPNIRNEDGCTPLLLSARQGYASSVQMLLRFGAKVSICDSVAGLSPVHHSAKNGYVHCLALLVDNAEDKNIINQPDTLHRTALMLSVSNLHIDCVTTLIKSGADPNILDNDGHSCLFRAVVTGQHSVLHMLLPRSTVVNTPDVNGKTILHVSAAYSKLACTQRILPYMEPNAAKGFDKENFTALQWACYSGNYECVALFFREGVFDCLEGNPFSSIHCAASSGSERCLDLLYKQFGPDTVKYKDMKYRTPLHVVAIHGHSDCALYLLDHGAEINFKDEDGRTPLMAAAMNGQIPVMEILISYKADKTVYDNNGNTALHLACLKKHNHAALLLLDFIDDSNVINMINNERKTPLHISARHGLVDVTRQLIAKGSSVLAIDANGLTPALCCAPNPSVAQCLAIILASHPMQVQGANCKDILYELQILRTSIKSLIPRPKRRKRRHLQTDITMVRNPDRFELEHMFDVKFDKTDTELEFRDWMGNVYVKFDNKDSEQFGGPPKKKHKPRSGNYHGGEITSYSCHELHGSHSDMSLALKTIYSEEDYRKLIKQSVENLKKKQIVVDEVGKVKKLEEKHSNNTNVNVKIPPTMCSFRYDITDDTDTEIDSIDCYKEVCETLVHNYISELPSSTRRSDGIPLNPNRSPKATNKRLKPQKITIDEFAEHFERCPICKQFNQDIQDANPVHEPSIPLEVMKETVNKVLSKKGNSNNRCLYAFLNESFEINSDNAYMIFHGMVSPKCEPFIAKVLNLTEGEVEITESTDGEDKLKYWVKRSDSTIRERKLSSTRIKEIKVRSPPRVKNERVFPPKQMVKPRDFEAAKKCRELEPRSEPSLRNRGAIPKRRDVRKLPASRNIVKSISYEDKFPRSDTITTEAKRKSLETPTTTKRRRTDLMREKHMIISTFIDGSKIDSCGENNIAIFERKPPKNQVDAELLNQIPQYLCTLTSFHSHPLFVNQDVNSYFRCYPTYWCIPEVTNKKKDDEPSDSENELENRSFSDSHFLHKYRGESSAESKITPGNDISVIRSESQLRKGHVAPERQPILELNDKNDQLLYFNNLANNESANTSHSSNPAVVDEEEIEQLEAMRRLEDGITTDTDDPSDDTKGSCDLKRRAGVMDIQKYPKTVDVWAQLAEEYLKEKINEPKEEDESSSQGSKKRKLTINIPRITICDDCVEDDKKNRISGEMRHTNTDNNSRQKKNNEIVEYTKTETNNVNINGNKQKEEQEVTNVIDENDQKIENEKEVLIYTLQMNKKGFTESKDDSEMSVITEIDTEIGNASSNTCWSTIKETKNYQTYVCNKINNMNNKVEESVNSESNSVVMEFYQSTSGQTTDWQKVENNSQPLLTKMKTVESIYRSPAKNEPSKKLIDNAPSVIDLDESEKCTCKSKESNISEDDPIRMFKCKEVESDVCLESDDLNVVSVNQEPIQNIYENLVTQPSSSHTSFQVGKTSLTKSNVTSLETSKEEEAKFFQEDDNRSVCYSQSLPISKIQKDKVDYKKKCRNYSNIYENNKEKGKSIESKISIDSPKADFKSVPRDLKHVAKTQDIQRDSRSKSQESRSPEKRIPRKISDNKSDKSFSSDSYSGSNHRSILKDFKRSSESCNKSPDSKGSKNKTDSVISMEKATFNEKLNKKPIRNLEQRYYSPNRRMQIDKGKIKITGEIHSQLPVKKKTEPTRIPEKVRSRSVDITTRSSMDQTKTKTMTYESKHAVTTSDFIPPKIAQKPLQKEEHKSRKDDQVKLPTEKESESMVEDETEEGSANDSMIVHPSLHTGTVDLSEFGISDNSMEDDDTIAEIQSIEDDTLHDKREISTTRDNTKKIKHREEEETVTPKTTIYESSTTEPDDFVCRKKTQSAKVEWEMSEPPRSNIFEKKKKKLTSREFWNKKEDLGLKIEFENDVMNIEDAIHGRSKCGKKVIFSDKVMFMDEQEQKESVDDEASRTHTEIDPEIIELSIKLPDVSFAEDIICQNTEIEYCKPGPSKCSTDNNNSNNINSVNNNSSIVNSSSNVNSTSNDSSSSYEKKDAPPSSNKHFLETIPIEKLVEKLVSPASISTPQLSTVSTAIDALESEVALPESSTEEESTGLLVEDESRSGEESTHLKSDTNEDSDNFKTVKEDTEESSDVTEMDTSKYFSPPENEIEKKKMMLVNSIEQSSRECPAEEIVTDTSEELLHPLASIEELSEVDTTHSTSYEFHDAVEADKSTYCDDVEDSDTGNEMNVFFETDEEKSEDAGQQQSMETIPEERSYELTDSARTEEKRRREDKPKTYNIYNIIMEQQNMMGTSALHTSTSTLIEERESKEDVREETRLIEYSERVLITDFIEPNVEIGEIEDEPDDSYMMLNEIIPPPDEIFLSPPKMMEEETHIINQENQETNEYIKQFKRVEISEVSSVRTIDSLLHDEMQFAPGNTIRIMKITETCESVQKVFDNTEQFNTYKSDFNLTQANFESSGSCSTVKTSSDPILKRNTPASPSIASTSSTGSCEVSNIESIPKMRKEKRFLSDIEEDTDELNNSKAFEESAEDNSKTTISINLSREYESPTPDNTDDCSLENKFSKGDNTLNNSNNKHSSNNLFSVDSSNSKLKNNKADYIIARSEITTSIPQAYLSSEDTNEFFELNDELQSCNATKKVISDTTLDDEDTMNIEDNLSEDEVRMDDRFLGQILEVEEDSDFYKAKKTPEKKPERTPEPTRISLLGELTLQEDLTDNVTFDSFGHICPRIKLTQHYVEENHSFSTDEGHDKVLVTTDESGADELSVDSGSLPRIDSPEPSKKCLKLKANASTDDEECLVSEKDLKQAKSRKSFPSISKIGKKARKDSNCKIT